MIDSITDEEIRKARHVLSCHVVEPLTKEGALESLIFCIGSQGFPWGNASRLVYNLRRRSYPDDGAAVQKQSSMDVLTDKVVVHNVSIESGWRFHHERRFDDAIDYVKSAGDDLIPSVINADTTMREKYVKSIQYCGNKTFSFWHLCLGGTKLMALDVHVMRGLHSLGVTLDPTYFTSVERKSGKHPQAVRRTPSRKDYHRIEEDARKLFASDERFLKQDGSVDMALADSVLWWRGARRTTHPNLFAETDAWQLPYARGLECYVSSPTAVATRKEKAPQTS